MVRSVVVRLRSFVLGTAVASVLTVAVACSSGSSSGSSGGPPANDASVSLDALPGLLEPDAGSCSSPGGPVLGPSDDHCSEPDGGRIVQPTTVAGCTADAAPGGGGGDDGGGTMDAGDIGNCGDPGFGATMYDDTGSDDDCKYDVAWTSTPICRNQPVYFTVIVTKRTDGSPLRGANARPDYVLACKHPGNISLARDPSPEIAPGTYVVGPVVFDQPGKWVFRFHFDETCLDISPESPHGHAAFWVDVP